MELSLRPILVYCGGEGVSVADDAGSNQLSMNCDDDWKFQVDGVSTNFTYTPTAYLDNTTKWKVKVMTTQRSSMLRTCFLQKI